MSTTVTYQPSEIATIEKITKNINEFKGNQPAVYKDIITKYPLPNQCTEINKQIRLHTWYLLDSVIADLVKIINFAVTEFTKIYSNATNLSSTPKQAIKQDIDIGNGKTINRRELSINAVTTNIYILPLDFKKELTQQDYDELLSSDPKSVVDSGLINSGLCTNTDIYNRDIFIYRSCEMGFVLLHELVHNYNVEYLFMDNGDYGQINKYLKETFQIDRPISTEAGTDAIAHVLWLKYLYENVYQGNTVVFTKVFNKINNITGIRAVNMIKLFLQISESRYSTILPSIIIKETTGAFEYFVVKFSLLKYISYGTEYLFNKQMMPISANIEDLLPKLMNDIQEMIIEASKTSFPTLPLSLNRSLI